MKVIAEIGSVYQGTKTWRRAGGPKMRPVNVTSI